MENNEEQKKLWVDEAYCRSCGSIIKKEAEICPSCGVRQNTFNQNMGNNLSSEQSNQSTEIKYAGFWIRFVAYFIDGLVISAIQFIIGIVMALLSPILGPLFSIVATFIGWMISWLYYIVLTNNYQATLGKMAVGIRVTSDMNEKATLGKIILRETLGKILSLIILGFGFFMAGWTQKKQALHDFVAGTWVVYKDPKKKNNAVVVVVIVIIAILFILAITGILASTVLVSLNSARNKAIVASYKATVASIAPAVTICCDESKNKLQSIPGSDVCDLEIGTQLPMASELKAAGVTYTITAQCSSANPTISVKPTGLPVDACNSAATVGVLGADFPSGC